MTEKQIQHLNQFGKLNTNVSLTTLTTVKVGGIVDGVLYPKNIVSLVAALAYCKEEAIEHFIFGNGSNILASDDSYHGLIIKLTRTINQVYSWDDSYYVEAGASLPSLAYQAMRHGYSGLEWAGGIPGSVGGATFMNAGAYKSSMSNIIEKVLVYKDDKIEWMSKEECEFSYRTSIFQKQKDWLILAVNLKLTKESKETIEELMNQRQERRIATQPLDQYSFGSCFRNGEKPSWQYIEEAGLKGYQKGDVAVSIKHSNFVVNTKSATFEDMIDVIELIQKQVKQQFNVDLILEVESFNWRKTAKHR